MYKLLFEHLVGRVTSVLRLSDNASIPMVEENADYQKYLKWLAEGNTPLPAEENT